MAAKINKDKYFKTLGHFTVAEWFLLGVEGKLELTELQNFSTKKQLINHIGTKCPQFFKNLNQPIYFKSSETDGKETLTIIMDEPVDIKKYKEKPNTRWVLTEQEIKDIIGKDANDLNATSLDVESLRSADLLSEDEQEPAEQTSCERPPSEQGNKITGIYKQKIRYESDMEINRFLTQVETYAYANGISNDSDMIAIAVAAINQTDEGALAHGLITDSDYTNWDSFRTKLSKILGHGKKYYRHKFETFQRGNMRLGLALSTLTQAFKRGWGIADELSDNEQEMVKAQFVRSLSGSLKLLLKAEINKLTLETILDRAIELEACFDEEGMETVNAIQKAPEVPDKLTNILESLQSQHKSMMDLQKSCADALSRMSVDAKRQNNQTSSQGQKFKSKSNFDYKKLNGLCIYYSQDKNCRNRFCRYKHSGPIPQEVCDLFKNK